MTTPETATRLILPLHEIESEELAQTADISSWANGANAAELAAAFLILTLPSITNHKGNNSNVIERTLSELVSSLGTHSAMVEMREAVRQKWSADLFNEGLRLLPYQGIDLLKGASSGSDTYLKPDGSWDFDFSGKLAGERSPFSVEVESRPGRFHSLTDPQGRSFLQVLSEPDESVNLQGYAGSGKTFLVDAIVSALAAERTLILAFTKPQLNALVGRLSVQGVHAMTFSQIADKVIERYLPRKIPGARARSDSRFQVNDQEIARQLGFHAVGTLSPASVANAARRTVMSFCGTAAGAIQEDHLPALSDRLSPACKALLMSAASVLWKQTIEPSSPDIALPLRAYHKIKHWSLSDIPLPPTYAHVIVDEAHEISSSLMLILDRSPQAVITLGDRFQRLNGMAPTRRKDIREKEINMTVRAGRQIEEVLNPLILKHPGKVHEPLIGTSHKRTHIRYYDRPSIPEYPTTILTGTDWTLFEWFQRLSYERAKFAILPGSLYSFRGLIEGCLDLFRLGKRSNHPFLFRYPTWDSLANAQSSNQAFVRIQRMLEKGYSPEDFENSFSAMVTPDKARIILGKVQDSKNMEFDSVLLAPELLTNLDSASTPWAQATKLSQIYTGGSRARFELVVPGYLKDWLEDQ